jgi:hypothetical protein
MKYKAITDSVKNALGLPAADDDRLLAELNLLRLDVAAHTDWWFLRRMVSQAYTAVTPIVLANPYAVLGVRAVFGSNGRIYYHGVQGMLPRGTGLNFWTYQVPSGIQVASKSIRLWDSNGGEISSDTVSVHYWIAPEEILTATLATTDLEFPGVAAFVAGLHGRWLRYQELKVEAAGPYEQQFVSELATMAARNPQAAIPPVLSRGGIVFSTGDRI